MHSIQFVRLFVTVAAIGILSCSKENGDLPSEAKETIESPVASLVSGVYTPPVLASQSKRILVDASRDGGVWWYPQYEATGFSAAQPHQGKVLADYFRSLGYQVDELGRGTQITWELLSQYNKVIRAGGAGSYTSSEIAAYDSLLARHSALLLMQDHHKNFPNDALAQRLNLPFSGAVTGTINRFATHAITTGVTSHPYIAGSVIQNPDKNIITVLGTIGTSAAAQESTGSAVMGILHHPTSRVFFIGDVNRLQQVPQPLTDNMIKWLFQ